MSDRCDVPGVENLRYVIPTGVYDGMLVFVTLKGRLVPGKVLAAMGATARVACFNPYIDTWFRLDELRVPEQDLKPR